MTRVERTERNRAFGFIAPALLWVLAFFVLPFLVMAVMSMARLEGRTIVQGLFPDNYVRFFTDPSLFKGLVVSLEITAIVTVISILLAYPLAWIIAMRVPARFQRLALMLAVLPFRQRRRPGR